MAERIVRTTLQAVVTNYVAGMEKASKATALTATEAQRLAAQGQAFTSLGASALKMGLVVGVGLAVAIAKFAEFDVAISAVKAATQETAENMGLLREAAIQAGADTAYSATEAANAIEELGKAGLTTQQILNGGLDGALTLAAAGNIGVAEAAGYAAIAMKQFGLEGEALPHVADLLAAGAGKAVGDVSDLAQALGQAGLVANGAGQSIEGTTGVLAAFADAGLLGSDAGTSLKSALIALQAPTDKASALMEQYTLDFYDGNGAMLSYAEIAGQLQSKLGDLSDEERNAALAKIFGNDALRSANVLYKEGAKGIQGYIDQTNDAGYAAKVAADRMDNLSGDVEKLGGSFDTALIKSGSGANDVLRGFVQSVTFLTDAFGALPEPVLATGLAFGVAATATLLAGGAALVAIPKFAALKATLDASGVSAGTFAYRTVMIGGALSVATLAIGYFVGKAAEAAANTSEFKDSLDQTTGALTAYTRELVVKKLTEADAFSQAAEFGISQKDLTNAVLEGGSAYDDISDKIKGYNSAFNLWGSDNAFVAGNAINAIRGVRGSVVDAGEAFEDEAAAADDSAESTGEAAKAYTDAADQAQALTDNLMSLIETINEANGVGQDAVTTNANYQKTLAEVATYVDGARKGLEGFTLGWAANTVEGSANRAMLAGLAADAQKAAEAQLALDGNTAAYIATITASNQAIYDNAIALGATDAEARSLADSVNAIPDAKTVQIIADTASAQTAIDRFLSVNASKRINIAVGPGGQGGQVEGKATGGAIYGPGTGTSDTAGLYALSNGEHVWTTAEVAAAGGQGAVYEMRRAVLAGRGRAAGGEIGYASQVQYAPQGPASYGYGGSGGVTKNITVHTEVSGIVGMTESASATLWEQKTNNALRGL